MIIRGDYMKKLLLIYVFALVIVGFPKHIEAETISYPFDEIKIVSAFKFDITIDQTISESSVLYQKVSENEILTIYIGSLEFMSNGEIVEASPSMMIVTNQNNEDILRWLINSGHYGDTTIDQSYASWILIEPLLGVVKDLSVEQMEVSFHYDMILETYAFIDNTGMSFQMNDNSLVEEDDLDIIISAYVEVTS